MENNWKAWIPHRDLENKYFIWKIVDDEDGLQLLLISNGLYEENMCPVSRYGICLSKSA